MYAQPVGKVGHVKAVPPLGVQASPAAAGAVPATGVIATPSFKHIESAVLKDFSVDCAVAIRPLTRALLRDANTTDERSPIIAITTKSSIRVKPLLLFFFIKLTTNIKLISRVIIAHNRKENSRVWISASNRTYTVE